VSPQGFGTGEALEQPPRSHRRALATARGSSDPTVTRRPSRSWWRAVAGI